MRDHFRSGRFASDIQNWYGQNPNMTVYWRKLPEESEGSEILHIEGEILQTDDTDSIEIVDKPPPEKNQDQEQQGNAHGTNLGSGPGQVNWAGMPLPTTLTPQQMSGHYGQNYPEYYPEYLRKNDTKTPYPNAYADSANSQFVNLNRWGMAPQMNIEIPEFTGSISRDSLVLITNQIALQFRRLIPAEVEKTLTVCDPASRMVGALVEQDEAL
eukprot:scaffold34200_cov24-Cyclotella_meneghiniana.AAC.5